MRVAGTGYQSLGGVVTGSPSAVVATDAKGSPSIYVFVRNTSGSLSMKAYYKDPETDLYALADWRGINKSLPCAHLRGHGGGPDADCYARNEAGTHWSFRRFSPPARRSTLAARRKSAPA